MPSSGCIQRSKPCPRQRFVFSYVATTLTPWPVPCMPFVLVGEWKLQRTACALQGAGRSQLRMVDTQMFILLWLFWERVQYFIVRSIRPSETTRQNSSDMFFTCLSLLVLRLHHDPLFCWLCRCYQGWRRADRHQRDYGARGGVRGHHATDEV